MLRFKPGDQVARKSGKIEIFEKYIGCVRRGGCDSVSFCFGHTITDKNREEDGCGWSGLSGSLESVYKLIKPNWVDIQL